MKKTTFLPEVCALALVAFTASASAQLTVLAPGYGVQGYYTHTTSDWIVSYDWDAAANLYYMTAAGYPDMNVWKASGNDLLNIYSRPTNYSGASVVNIGDYIYFNDSNAANSQFIRRYGPLSGSPVTTLTSNAKNYGLYAHDGELFITGATGFGTNHIFHSTLAADGTLQNIPPKDLGETSGSSGPLAFDLDGNLYYAPGFGDLSIYKWSAEELAGAIADPINDPLDVTGHLWLDYSSLYSTVGGATSMLLDGEGDLLVTLTSFTDPSLLVEFGTTAGGRYDGTHTAILSDTGRLGELRNHGGDIFLASGNQIVQVIPEPGTALFALGCLGALFFLRPRQRFAGVLALGLPAIVAAFVLTGFTPASAGIYSSYSGTTAGAPDNPIPRASLTTFETSIVNYSPAPGVGPNFQNPATSFGPLGDLYSPVLRPVANTPFNKAYQPQVGTKPNAFHAGSGSSTAFNGNINDQGDTYGFIGIDAPGSITLGFSASIYDGVGADFAVFENGFAFGGPTSLFAELAYVEVSSNGTNFARFDSISLNTAATAVSGTFQGYDMTNVYNLAGKHASNWGTPFDLNQLAGNSLVTSGLLDLSDIRYVRLVDVVGSGNLLDNDGNVISGVSRDSLGNAILDNWITYDSGGFDYLGLSTGAVGVIHSVAPVPEPSSLGFLLAITAVFVRRKRRA